MIESNSTETIAQADAHRPELAYVPSKRATVKVSFPDVPSAMEVVGGVLSLLRDIAETQAAGEAQLSPDSPTGILALHDVLAASIQGLADMVGESRQ